MNGAQALLLFANAYPSEGNIFYTSLCEHQFNCKGKKEV